MKRNQIFSFAGVWRLLATRQKWIALAGVFFASAISLQAAPWKFFAACDSRGSDNGINSNILAELAAEIVTQEVDFVVFPGDLITGSTTDYATMTNQFSHWRDAMQPVYDAGISVYPVRGNHDDDNLAAWNDIFTGTYALPTNGPSGESNLTFSAVHSNLLVIGLDAYVDEARVNQEWLTSQLAANEQPHVLVFAHEPAFKVQHTDCLADHQSNRDAFWSSLAAAGSRVYFCGHDHFYDHARIDDGDANESNDLHQFVVGTAGAPLYNTGPYDGNNSGYTPTNVYHEKQYGYMVGEVDGDDITLTWWHRTGVGTYAATAGQMSYTAAPGRQTDLLSFQQGVDGYSSTVDTKLSEVASNTDYSVSAVMEVDTSSAKQVLLRFGNIFGPGTDQIPEEYITIHWSGLSLNTTDPGDGATLHRMLSDWIDTDTWNMWGSGIQADGVEAEAGGDVLTYHENSGRTVVDVTASLQAWSADANPTNANKGWAFLSSGPDGWDFDSSEGGTEPRLMVTFSDDLAAQGTPHWWMASYGLTNGGLTFDQAETNNPDQDAYTSAQEYILDTSPVVSNGLYFLDAPALSTTSIVTFACSTGRVYSLEVNTNQLAGAWQAVSGQTRIPGDASGTLSMVDTNDVEFGLYRVRVELP